MVKTVPCPHLRGCPAVPLTRRHEQSPAVAALGAPLGRFEGYIGVSHDCFGLGELLCLRILGTRKFLDFIKDPSQGDLAFMKAKRHPMDNRAQEYPTSQFPVLVPGAFLCLRAQVSVMQHAAQSRRRLSATAAQPTTHQAG